MRKTTKILTQVALTCFAAAPFFAVAAQQNQKECAEAEAESDRLKDWNSAYEFFKRFAHCDDGAVADGYTESVARLFAKDWNHLGIFSRLASKDKEFKTFVLRHIDETAHSDDLKAIVENAKHRCPYGKRTICRSLELKARDSLRNLAM